MSRLYFDANATTPPHPEAVEAVRRAMAEDWANPTSTHREGQRPRFRLEEARRELAASLGVAPGELVFCASATEALHLLIRGLHPALGDRPAAVFPGEHSACLNPLRDWSRVSWLPEVPAGCATVVQMAASNETGILYGMPGTPEAVRIKDCCQAWGKVPVDLSDCDAAVFSGHKMGGPRGAALVRRRVERHPPVPGELDLHPGLDVVAGHDHLVGAVLRRVGHEAQHDAGRQAELPCHDGHRRGVLLAVAHHEVARQQRGQPVGAVARERLLLAVLEAVAEVAALREARLEALGHEGRRRRGRGGRAAVRHGGVGGAQQLREANLADRGVLEVRVLRLLGHDGVDAPPGPVGDAVDQHGGAGRVVVAQLRGEVGCTGAGEGELLGVPDGGQPEQRHVVRLELDVRPRAAGGSGSPAYTGFAFTYEPVVSAAAVGAYAAQSAVAQGDNPFADLHRRWIAQGLSSKLARRNVARSLAATLWGLWKNGSVYEPKWVGAAAAALARTKQSW